METTPPTLTPRPAASSQQWFPPETWAVAAVRRYVVETLTGWGRVDRLDEVRLCVSELATNALMHGAPPRRLFAVRVAADDAAVRVEVRDGGGHGVPAPRVADVSEERGRGLTLVAALADDWGVVPHADGKTVWAAFTLRAPAAR